MEDYRMAALKSKLVELDKERERIMTTIDVLKELDSESVPPIGASQQTAKNGTMIDAILSILRPSGRMMKTNDIYNRVKQERNTTSKAAVYTALSRLQKRGKVFNDNGSWKLVVRGGAAEPEQKEYHHRLISTEQ